MQKFKKINMIVRYILYVLIIISTLIYYNHHNKKIIQKKISIDFLKIKIALNKNDIKTLNNLTKKILKRKNNNIYYLNTLLIFYNLNYENNIQNMKIKKYTTHNIKHINNKKYKLKLL